MPSKAKARTAKSPVVEIHSSAKPGFIPIIGMLVFAVVVVTSGGVLFAAYQQSKKPVETIPVVLKTDAGSSQNANVNLNINASADTGTIPMGWKSYTNSDLGISFAYPAEFGDVTISITTPESVQFQTGKKITGSFSNFAGLTFGGITTDYEYGAGGQITDTRGFLEQNGAYYFKFVSDKPDTGTPLEPLAVLMTQDERKALVLESNSFVNDRGVEGPTFGASLGDFNLSALVNIADDEFTGLMFVNTDTKNFSREKFEQFVRTIEASTVDELAEWKTYTNSQYGFSFRYPSDLVYRDLDNQETGLPYVRFTSDDGNRAFDVSVWSEELDPNNVQGVYGKAVTTTVQVGDKNGYQYKEGDAGCGGDFIKIALSSNTILRLYFGSCEDETNQFETTLALRSRLLSTFQFSAPLTTDASSSASPTLKVVESELFNTGYGKGDISNIKCNDSYCLVNVSSAGWVYKILKFQNGEVSDVSSQFADLNKESNSVNYSWNGSYWLVALNGNIYTYNGSSATKIDLPAGIFAGAYGLAWNGSTWLISSVFMGVESRTKFWQYDGQKITVINQDALSGSINTVAWNGKYWLAGGYDETSELTSPLLYRINGNDIQNVSNLLAENSGFSVNDIIWADKSWKLSMYHRATSTETPLLLSYDGTQVSDITNQLISFQNKNADELSGDDGLYAVSAHRRPGLQVWRNGQATDLTKYIGTNNIDSLETHDDQVLAGAVNGKLLIVTF